MAWSSGMHGLTSAATILAAHHPVGPLHPQLSAVMVYGFTSTLITAACYVHRHSGRLAMLTFAASLAATGAYGFLEGAWPLGLLESAWAINAARRGLHAGGFSRKRRPGTGSFVPDLHSRQSRYGHMPGLN